MKRKRKRKRKLKRKEKLNQKMKSTFSDLNSTPLLRFLLWRNCLPSSLIPF